MMNMVTIIIILMMVTTMMNGDDKDGGEALPSNREASDYDYRGLFMSNFKKSLLRDWHEGQKQLKK